MKNYIEHKGFKILVAGNTLRYYKKGEELARTIGFIHSFAQKEDGDNIAMVLKDPHGELKEYTHMVISKEQYKELINIRENIRKEIRDFFDNVEGINIEKLEDGKYKIISYEDEINQLKELSLSDYLDAEELWIEENKEYFTDDEINIAYSGEEDNFVPVLIFLQKNKSRAERERM